METLVQSRGNCKQKKGSSGGTQGLDIPKCAFDRELFKDGNKIHYKIQLEGSTSNGPNKLFKFAFCKITAFETFPRKSAIK